MVCKISVGGAIGREIAPESQQDNKKLGGETHMAIFKKNMRAIMMNAGMLYKLDPLFATRRGGELILLWGDAKASAEYFYGSNFLDSDNSDEAWFFVLADYLTYIPYGSSGYAAFEKMLKAVSPHMSVAQFRFEWLKKCVGKRLTCMNDGQLEYVKYFFENYNKKSVDLNIPAEVASLICRIHHECEAHFGKDGYSNLMVLSDLTSNFAYSIGEFYEQQRYLEAESVLSEVPPYGMLSEDELDFIRKFTGLSEG